MHDALSYKPVILTMGDPGGIGPEIIINLWNKRKELNLAPFAVTGCSVAFSHYDQDLALQTITSPSDCHHSFDTHLPIIQTSNIVSVTTGVSDPKNGLAVIQAIDMAVKFCREGLASAMVTMPIQKSSLYKAGFTAPGHTEYIATLCNEPADSSVMMLANNKLRVVAVTVHTALAEVPHILTTQMIIDRGVKTAISLRDHFGIKNPRIAVSGLNPHAGEDGMMGIEDGVKIVPAIRALNDMGIQASGPHPADTLFHQEARADYDVALCMYHDQALIPVKTIDFHGSVNVTLGLEVIRTSPDHGTALNIAGQGKARIDSSLNALRMAVDMAAHNSKRLENA